MNNVSFSHQLTGTVNPYITAAGTTVIGRAPADGVGGGVTITAAFAQARGGTSTLTVVDLGAAGTGVPAGTICTVALSGVGDHVAAGAPNGYWLDGGNYIGVVYGVGTVTLPSGLVINGVVGR